MYFSDWGIILQITGIILFLPPVRMCILLIYQTYWIFKKLLRVNVEEKFKLTVKEILKETFDSSEIIWNNLRKKGFSFNDLLVTKRGILLSFFALSLIIVGIIFQLSWLNPHPPTIIFNF